MRASEFGANQALASYAVAMAAGQDAGTRRMRADGRIEWDEADFNHAASVTARLLQPLSGAELIASRKQYRAGA